MQFCLVQFIGAALLSALLLMACPTAMAANATAFQQSGDPIVLAGIWATSGRSAASSKIVIEGAQCGVRYVNVLGGVNGRPLELKIYDTRSSEEGAAEAVERAVVDRPALLLGAGWSDYTLPAARAAQAHGIPLISSVATTPNITLVGNYIFRVCFSDALQGKVLAAYARNELGLKRAAVLRDAESTYSAELARSFARTFEELGGRVVFEQTYIYFNSDYGPVVDLARQATPDILFVAGHDESALILKSAEAIGLDAVFMGGDGWDTPSFMKKGGDSLSQGYFTTHWAPELDGPMNKTFLEFCNMPDAMSALAFDAVLLAADALLRADPADPAAVRDALLATRDFNGVTGILEMNAWGDAVKSVVLKQIVNGEQRVIQRYAP